MSEFKVEIVKINGVAKHPNADSLSYTVIFGQNVIFRSAEFKDGDLVAYIPYDAVVPTDKPLFKFLQKGDKTTARIKPVRLRGMYSEGILIPAPKGTTEGQDVAEMLGVTKYVEPDVWTPTATVGVKNTWQYRLKKAINSVSWKLFGVPVFNLHIGDPGLMPKYEIENYLRYKHVLTDPIALDINPDALAARPLNVVVSEKLHGCVSPGAKITMSDGSYRRIKDIQVGESVLGMDEKGFV